MTIKQSESIRRAEKQLLLQEIAKNKDLTDKIDKLRKIFTQRAENFKQALEDNTINRELRINTSGHMSEAQLVVFEIDKLMNRKEPELEGCFIKE